MSIATFLRIGRLSPAQRWRRMNGRQRVIFGLVACLIAFAGWRAYLWWTVWSPRLVLSGSGSGVVMPLDFSPDGSLIATSTPAKGVSLWDTKTGEERTVCALPRPRWAFTGRFTDDGRTFLVAWLDRASGKPFSIDVIDVASGKTRATVPMPVEGFFDLIFLPGGTTARVLLCDNSVQLYVVDFDLTTGEATPARKLPTRKFRSVVRLSPDARTVAHNLDASWAKGAADPRVGLWDYGGEGVASTLAVPMSTPMTSALAFASGGATLAVGREDGSVELWDVASGSISETIRDHDATYGVHGLTYSADGQILASGARYNGSGYTLDRLKFFYAMHHNRKNYEPPVEVVVRDVKAGKVLGRVYPDEGRAILSRDGRMLATFGHDGTTKIRDVPR